MIYGSPSEKRNFFSSLQIESESDPIIADYEIYLQGSEIPPEKMKPGVISAFATPADYEDLYERFSEISTRTIEPVTIEIETNFELEGPELDITFPPIALVYIIDQCGRSIACLDYNGVIHTCDFYHTARDFRESFIKILTELNTYRDDLPTKIVMNVINVLSNFSPERVAKITVTTEFDIDAYVKQAEKTVTEAIKSAEQIYETRLNALRVSKDIEIAKLKAEAADAKRAAVAEALKVLSMPFMKNWKVSEDREYLEYKKTIYVTRIKRQGMIYPVKTKKLFISGIRVKIVPNVTEDDIVFTKAFHPNVLDRICLGDLSGGNILDVLEKLPEELATANMDSTFSNDASSYILNKFDRLTTSEDSSTAPAEVWVAT